MIPAPAPAAPPLVTPTRARGELLLCYGFFATLALVPASGLMPLKVVLLVGFGCGAALALRRRPRFRLSEVVLGLALPAFLLTSFLLGLLRGSIDLDLGARALTNYTGVFVIVFVTYLLSRRGLVTLQSFFLALLVGNSCYLAVKAALLALMVLGVLPPETVVRYATAIAPGAAVQELGGVTLLARIAVVNDILTPFVFALVLIAPQLRIQLNRVVRVAYGSIAVAMMTLSLTRYVWLTVIVAVAAYHGLWPRYLARGVTLAGAVACLWFVMASGFTEPSTLLRAMIGARLGDVESISVKREQTAAIMGEVSQHPILGNGIGAYVGDYVRDERLQFQYEVQWAGLLMQLGIVGIGIVAAYLLSVVRWFRAGRVGMYLLLLYALWLGSGFFNPYLTALSSSAVYALFVVAGIHLSTQATGRAQALAASRSP